MAGAMDVTFHRAFDMCADLMLTLEDVYQTGIRRVLTSGGRNTAPEGLEILANLTAAAGDRLSIMASSGVRATNLEALYLAGIRDFHSSASTTTPSPTQYRNPHTRMGKQSEPAKYKRPLAADTIVTKLRRPSHPLHCQ